MQLRDATFLITGGGSGLGAACARLFAAAVRVVIADLNAEAGGVLAGEIGAAGRFIQADVTDEASVRGAVATAEWEFGPLRGAINCAGVATAERVLGREGPHALDSFARVVGVNLIGTFNVIRLAAEALAANEPLGPSGERGMIINTASVAAFDGQIGQAAYSASKGAWRR
jgi:NAD(P)-dependent dehydrogenase (short-subunit alcohol dehydrogenase family)